MMKNPAYAGMRYCNRKTEVKDDPRRKRGRTILRDRLEWIGIAVPPLVSAELFDRVQERLALNLQRPPRTTRSRALSSAANAARPFARTGATSPMSWFLNDCAAALEP
jgi:hypothetical protein